MRSNDVRDDLADGFELHRGPFPQEPVRAAAPPRPRLCEAGPCHNYHRFEIQIEAEDPRARKVPVRLPFAPGVQPVPDGAVYQAPPAFYTQTHHYCYPTVGVEMNLGALPVVQCNRWYPAGLTATPEGFWASPDGQKFIADVAAWEAERASRTQEADEIERLIEESQSITATPGDTP